MCCQRLNISNIILIILVQCTKIDGQKTLGAIARTFELTYRDTKTARSIAYVSMRQLKFLCITNCETCLRLATERLVLKQRSAANLLDTCLCALCYCGSRSSCWFLFPWYYFSQNITMPLVRKPPPTPRSAAF